MLKTFHQPTGSTVKMKLCLELPDFETHPQSVGVGPAAAKNRVHLKFFPKLYSLKMFYIFFTVHPNLSFFKAESGFTEAAGGSRQ